MARKYELDPLILRKRQTDKLARELRKQIEREEWIRREVTRLGIMKRGRSR